MEQKPFVSVMVLCYNYGKMLQKALDTIAAQTFRDFEIVMINNGSTDDSEQVFRDFCAAHPDISTQYVWVYPNDGPVHGWNEGLLHARGEYVMFHDADDWMEPNCLEKLSGRARETDADRVTGCYQEVGPDGTVTRVRRFPQNSPELPTTMLQGVLFRRSVLMENDIVIQAKPYTIVYDCAITLGFAVHQEKPGVLVHETVYNYYLNPISWIQKLTDAGCVERDAEIFGRETLHICTAAMRHTEDENLRMQIEYLALRHYYAVIAIHFANLPQKEARRFYCLMHDELKRQLPNYGKKNKFLWPLGNGYEKGGSYACFLFFLLERLRLIGLISLAAKMGRNSKFIRKST